MPLAEIFAAVLILLVTPGPTNTLAALAGAERGVRAALPLIPVEIAGYLTTILPLTLAVGLLQGAGLPVDSGPTTGLAPGLVTFLKPAVTLMAAVWVLWLARRLWRRPTAHGRTVDVRTLFVTTVLNPKALIFGLVLLPAPDLAGLALHLGLFTTAVAGVALGWILLGAALAQRPGADPGRESAAGGATALPGWARRTAALWLGTVALWLAAHGAGLVA